MCLFLPEREWEWVNLLRLQMARVTSAREARKYSSLNLSTRKIMGSDAGKDEDISEAPVKR